MKALSATSSVDFAVITPAKSYTERLWKRIETEITFILSCQSMLMVPFFGLQTYPHRLVRMHNTVAIFIYFQKISVCRWNSGCKKNIVLPGVPLSPQKNIQSTFVWINQAFNCTSGCPSRFSILFKGLQTFNDQRVYSLSQWMRIDLVKAVTQVSITLVSLILSLSPIMAACDAGPSVKCHYLSGNN